MSYTADDIQQILQRAMTRQQDEAFSAAQLEEMAAELGISTQDLQAAKAEWLTQRDTIQKRQRVNAYKRRGFMAHLIPFVAVNLFLILLNLATTPQRFWAIYPFLGWGLGLTLHGLSVYRPDDGADLPGPTEFKGKSSCMRSHPF
jgi:2TM domain